MARVCWGFRPAGSHRLALTLDPKLDPKLMFGSGDGWGIAVGGRKPQGAHAEAIT
jgi:hypothetical protein